MTHLLALLLNRPWTANVPVLSVMSPAGGICHAQMSPISPLMLSYQPLGGCGSVWLSESSWPSTMLTPSRLPAGPELMKFLPQLEPASAMYGRFVYDTSLAPLMKSPWYAQYCVPKPLELWPCDVATTYEASRLKPKCATPRAAAAWICASVGFVGIAVESTHVPLSCPTAFLMWCLRPPSIS